MLIFLAKKHLLLTWNSGSTQSVQIPTKSLTNLSSDQSNLVKQCNLTLGINSRTFNKILKISFLGNIASQEGNIAVSKLNILTHCLLLMKELDRSVYGRRIKRSLIKPIMKNQNGGNMQNNISSACPTLSCRERFKPNWIVISRLVKKYSLRMNSLLLKTVSKRVSLTRIIIPVKTYYLLNTVTVNSIATSIQYQLCL